MRYWLPAGGIDPNPNVSMFVVLSQHSGLDVVGHHHADERWLGRCGTDRADRQNLGGIIAVLGLGLVALPTGIITSGFAEAVEKKRAKQQSQPRKCPHCSGNLDQLP